MTFDTKFHLNYLSTYTAFHIFSYKWCKKLMLSENFVLFLISILNWSIQPFLSLSLLQKKSVVNKTHKNQQLNTVQIIKFIFYIKKPLIQLSIYDSVLLILFHINVL